MLLCTIQNELYEKDFQQERRDRERAHSLVDDKDKELKEALSEITVLQLTLEQQQPQQLQSSSQKQTGSWRPYRAIHTQPQVAELEEAKATAVQQVRSYKTLTDGYKKDLEAERKRTWELKQELESSRIKPTSSAMGAGAEERVSIVFLEFAFERNLQN